MSAYTKAGRADWEVGYSIDDDRGELSALNQWIGSASYWGVPLEVRTAVHCRCAELKTRIQCEEDRREREAAR